MGFASGLTAGSNMMSNVLNGASQRRERAQIMDMRQAEEDRTEFNEVKKAYQGMTIDPATGERRAHGDLVNDPAYQEIMLKLTNTNYARKKLFNDREVMGAIPTEDGNATIAVRGDDGKPKPFTLFGTREGDPGSEDDPIVSLRPEQLAMNFEKLLPYLDAETNVSEGILNAGLRAGMAGDFSKLEQMEQGGEQPPAQLGQGVSQANVTRTSDSSTDPVVSMLRPLVRRAESADDPTAVSPKGARGLMQVMPKTAMQPGNGVANIFDQADKLGIEYSGRTEDEAKRLSHTDAGTQLGENYLSAMHKRFKGNLDHTLAAYNYGPKATDEWIAGGGNFEDLPTETREYIAKIKNWMSNQEPELGDAELGGGGFTSEQIDTGDNFPRTEVEPGVATGEKSVKGKFNTWSKAGVAASVTSAVLGDESLRASIGSRNERIEKSAEGSEGSIGRSAGTVARVGVEAGGAAGDVAKAVWESGIKPSLEEAKQFAKNFSDAFNGEGSPDDALADGVAKETDSTVKQVESDLNKPVDEVDLATADAALDGQSAVFSERGVTDKQAEAIMKRSQREDSAKAYSGALAVGVSMGLITLPQAHDMLMKTQQTGMSLKEHYQTEKARLDVVKLELELANERNSAHLSTTGAGAQLRNQESLITNITGRLNMSTRITMGKVRDAFGVELTDEQMLTSVLGMVSVDPVGAEMLVPGLDVNALLNGDRSVDLGPDEMFLIGELMTHQLSYMYGGKGEERFFGNKKPDFSVFSKLATPESMKTGSVKLQDGSSKPVLDIVRSIYENPETSLEYKRYIRGMPNAELVEYLQSYVE